MTILGIDPGKSGGLACIRPDGSVELFGFGKTTHLAAVDSALGSGNPADFVAYFEQVGGYVGREQPGSAMFNFGSAAGEIRGILMARGVAIRFVTPQVWQKSVPTAAAIRKEIKVATLTLGDSLGRAQALAAQAGKRELCRVAKERFPHLKVTMQNCDALLIAAFGKTQHTTQP